MLGLHGRLRGRQARLRDPDLPSAGSPRRAVRHVKGIFERENGTFALDTSVGGRKYYNGGFPTRAAAEHHLRTEREIALPLVAVVLDEYYDHHGKHLRSAFTTCGAACRRGRNSAGTADQQCSSMDGGKTRPRCRPTTAMLRQTRCRPSGTIWPACWTWEEFGKPYPAI